MNQMSREYYMAIISAVIFGAVLIVQIYYIARTFRILYGDDPRSVRVGSVIKLVFGIYLVTIAVFGQCYAIIYSFDHDAFSFGDSPPFSTSWMSATYFSVATITSTGYGDIHAKSELAMLTASLEMLAGYLLTVVFFSSIAGLAFRNMKGPPSGDRRR